MKQAIYRLLMFCRDVLRFIYFLLNLVAAKSFFNPIKRKYDGTVAVLANGPSLKEVIPRLAVDPSFRDVDFMAMNYFAFDAVFREIKPKHYCLADPMFFREDHRIDNVRKLFDILQKDVDWDMTLYVPHYFAGSFARFSRITNEKITVVVVHSVEYGGHECFRNFFYRRGIAAPSVRNVSNLAIYAAINCGYSKILLYGVDHSFFDIHVDEHNRLCRKIIHYYEQDTVAVFAPMINSRGKIERMSRFLEFYAKLFKSHDHLAGYAKQMNATIINCTRDSLIDSYTRELMPDN